MKRSFLLLAFVVISLTACIISPGAFQELSRKYASDSSKYLLSYEYAQGPWDGGRSWLITVMQATDSVSGANKFRTFSNNDIDSMYWKGNDTVVIHEKYAHYISRGKSAFESSLFKINGAYIKIIQKDPIDSAYTRKIYYREVSPGGRYEVVVYRYVKPENHYYFLNVSVIPKGDSIPRFGNFFISWYEEECINGIKWRAGDTLDIQIHSVYGSIFNDYLVKNRPAIPFVISYNDEMKPYAQ